MWRVNSLYGDYAVPGNQYAMVFISMQWLLQAEHYEDKEMEKAMFLLF